jgi:L-amino acid N-acyltransferase YncA
MRIKSFAHDDGNEEFWAKMGPFFASPTVRNAVGGFMTSDARFTWWVAFERGRVIGFCAARADKKNAMYLTYAYVLPDHRGQGVYDALFHARMKDVLKTNPTRLWAVVNPKSEKIFYSEGFVKTGARGQYDIVERVEEAA